MKKIVRLLLAFATAMTVFAGGVWAIDTTDGKIAAEGKVAGCIGCHTANEGSDYLLTGSFK